MDRISLRPRPTTIPDMISGRVDPRVNSNGSSDTICHPGYTAMIGPLVHRAATLQKGHLLAHTYPDKKPCG
jgi:hypothetical protein